MSTQLRCRLIKSVSHPTTLVWGDLSDREMEGTVQAERKQGQVAERRLALRR